MPYEIKKDGEQFCVFNQDTEKKVPGGCHDTQQDAKDHLAALYANVEDVGKSQTFTSLSEAIKSRAEELSRKGGPGSGPHPGGGGSVSGVQGTAISISPSDVKAGDYVASRSDSTVSGVHGTVISVGTKNVKVSVAYNPGGLSRAIMQEHTIPKTDIVEAYRPS